MLRIDLIGNLGSEPDTRHTQANRELLEFRVAINQRRRTDDGQWEDAPAEWFRIRAIGSQLERARNLSKGDRVFVAGRLDIGHYTSRDSEPRTSFDVWADEITSLTPRTSADDGRAMPATAKSATGRADDTYDEGGDVPF
jgi:single-strand DNA-binding protein